MIYDCTDLRQTGIYSFYTIAKQNVVNGDVIYASVLQYINQKNQNTNQNACIIHEYKRKLNKEDFVVTSPELHVFELPADQLKVLE